MNHEYHKSQQRDGSTSDQPNQPKGELKDWVRELLEVEEALDARLHEMAKPHGILGRFGHTGVP